MLEVTNRTDYCEYLKALLDYHSIFEFSNEYLLLAREPTNTHTVIYIQHFTVSFHMFIPI